MKKRILAMIVVICIAAALTPITSRAAVTPYFIAVNDVLLPFNDDTMPYVTGGEIFVPRRIFEGVGVFSVASEELERVRIYTGASRYVDFYTARSLVEDQDGNVLPWPAARRVGSRFYVPLRQVCDFFGLTYEEVEVSRDIISQEQMWLIRIRQREGASGFNGPTFVVMNRSAIRNAYNEYHALPPPTPAAPPDVALPSPPTVEPPPKYNDVTIHHSFYNISAGGTNVILELLDASAAPDYRFCFFVSADDIIKDAGLIRRISGSGHTIGIWLTEGTYNEYLRTSALLYEAAKIKTLLVSADSETEHAFMKAGEHGVIFWETSQSLIYDDTFSVDAVTAMLPQESGARLNLIASCLENTALMLSGILLFLRQNEYSVMGITETTAPINS